MKALNNLIFTDMEQLKKSDNKCMQQLKVRLNFFDKKIHIGFEDELLDKTPKH